MRERERKRVAEKERERERERKRKRKRERERDRQRKCVRERERQSGVPNQQLVKKKDLIETILCIPLEADARMKISSDLYPISTQYLTTSHL